MMTRVVDVFNVSILVYWEWYVDVQFVDGYICERITVKCFVYIMNTGSLNRTVSNHNDMDVLYRRELLDYVLNYMNNNSNRIDFNSLFCYNPQINHNTLSLDQQQQQQLLQQQYNTTTCSNVFPMNNNSLQEIQQLQFCTNNRLIDYQNISNPQQLHNIFYKCTKAYYKRSHLNEHYHLHTGVKPYLCNQSGCNAKFSRADQLSRHRRAHTGERNFFCNVCLKRFKRSDHLKVHLTRNIHIHYYVIEYGVVF
ncbi:Krueppel-like factor 11 [Schistosoma japonicum]|nr:Krueppel-like factor 11 [Schistosoma japonicum]